MCDDTSSTPSHPFPFQKKTEGIIKKRNNMDRNFRVSF